MCKIQSLFKKNNFLSLGYSFFPTICDFTYQRHPAIDFTITILSCYVKQVRLPKSVMNKRDTRIKQIHGKSFNNLGICFVVSSQPASQRKSAKSMYLPDCVELSSVRLSNIVDASGEVGITEVDDVSVVV